MNFKKSLKKMFYSLLILVALVGVVVGFVLLLPDFGKLPSGARLDRIKASPNYREGKFQNLEHTPQITSDKSFAENVYDFLFKKVKDHRPKTPIPAVKTNLKNLPDNTLVWLGHSSYFLKIKGKNLLIDPVFHSASPFSFMIKPFEIQHQYSTADLPEIDLLIITHDHWDHLDYQAVKALQPHTKKVLTTLGVGEHLEYWGYASGQITELDWNKEAQLDGLKFTCLPTRHFSGRGLKATQTLWGSFMLETDEKTLYIGGDSGYGKHLADIGRRFPSIDLALLENGQYSDDWRHIHFVPNALHQAMKDLNAKTYFTGHNSKFALSKHAWYEPLEHISRLAEQDTTLNIITPKIGEVVHLHENQSFEKWWKPLL